MVIRVALKGHGYCFDILVEEVEVVRFKWS
jgi:hypothetical protein